jgi:hypothetical protein
MLLTKIFGSILPHAFPPHRMHMRITSEGCFYQ